VRPFFGAGIGAIVGLIIATIWNVNCDSLVEAASGCTRLEPTPMVGTGVAVGFIAGLVWAVSRRINHRHSDGD
jgi:hypothetical protein